MSEPAAPKSADADLPQARLVKPPARERWRRPLRWIKAACLAALSASIVVAGIGLLVLKAQACEAREAAECQALNGETITDVVRIKRIENGTRVIYRQRPGSTQIEMLTEGFCEQDFVSDVPPDKPMWVSKRTWMRNDQCLCGLTFHVRSITDPNVE